MGHLYTFQRVLRLGSVTARHLVVCFAETAEPIDLPFGLWTRVSRRKHRFNDIRQVAPMCQYGRAHRRHLANTIEPSVCGGDAVSRQITLTPCYYYRYTSSSHREEDDVPLHRTLECSPPFSARPGSAGSLLRRRRMTRRCNLHASYAEVHQRRRARQRPGPPARSHERDSISCRCGHGGSWRAAAEESADQIKTEKRARIIVGAAAAAPTRRALCRTV